MQAAKEAGASAIAAGSMFVFHGKQNGVLINYPKEEQLSAYLK
jgi:cyclase